MDYINSFLVKDSQKEIEGKRFGPRAMAYIIDFMILYGINVVTAYTFGIAFSLFMLFVNVLTGVDYYFDENENTVANWVLGITLSIIYFSIFEWLFGATGGKIILRMKVIDINGNGCSLKQAFVRSVYRFFDGLFFGAVGYSTMKAPMFQRFGDQRGQTVVVSSKSTAIKQLKPWWWFIIALFLYGLIAGPLQLLVAFLNIHFI